MLECKSHTTFGSLTTARRFDMMADSTIAKLHSRRADSTDKIQCDLFSILSHTVIGMIFCQASAVMKPVCFVAVQFKLASKALR